ncbi:NiFe hydrogenase [Shewanella psychrotolerans]|uniref:NiFe hydrogenase n=1 Tax=Shewanella psychrotolerans TaxID=2864206 RepID=UPI001C65D8C0|nr:NiFe hydrogenase [Shewanella psychrotolerans]QYK02978.1 NiFe hydrogenase [Shewanella psychrotolerans]
MKTIKFEFTCSRQVPLYAYLCNQYLNYNSLNITVSYQQGCYTIEADGEQADLESLADAIADDFLISVWLTDSRIALVDKTIGSKKELQNAAIEQEFCQRCAPLFGDNQSTQFGDIALACECCHGELRISPDYRGLTAADIQALCNKLMTNGEVTLAGNLPITLYLKEPSLNTNDINHRPRLLICNPNTLNAQFHLCDRQVLALSSIEKPLITVRPISDHPKLNAPLYDLCFAYNRLLIVIAERLRQQGIDWLFIDDSQKSTPLAFIDGAWAEIDHTGPSTISLTSKVKALHDEAIVESHGNHYLASNKKALFTVKQLTGQHDLSQSTPLELTNTEYGLCALHSIYLEHGINKHCAILYFSQYHGGQIQSIDGKGESELFFALPELPQSGYEIYHQLEQSPQKQVLDKFKQRYPDDYLRLLDLKLDAPSDNLTSLWAIAAVVLGLESRSMHVADLSDALIASAMAHRGANSPRIDYPLTRGHAYRSLNWCKTLGSLMSFRLADDRDNAKLAFGMHDSFADYLANWVEHLDLNLSIKAVALAGSEWRNPVLSQRVALRVGKNFALKFNQQLEIDGNNYAVGALMLKKRRR